MNFVVYWLGRAVVALVQALPLRGVARLGRGAGGLAWRLDARHRRVVLDGLTGAFGPEKSPAEIRALARETFRRIGENYLCAIKTAAMSFEELRPHLEFTGIERLPSSGQRPLPNVVVAIGHFGNFELYARFHQWRTDYRTATTYRALKQPGLNRLMEELRRRSGCRFFERRTEGGALREALRGGGVILGLLADQSSRGLRGPFLGRDCNTGLAPAILAQRYECDLYTAICYRVGLAQWRVELGAPVATRIDGHLRASEDVMTEVNRAFEVAVRRDPANWFWFHRRWKD
jgi:KDO2-lipid IV(A) lauroyltransferase